MRKMTYLFFPEIQVYDEGDDDEAEARRYFAEELSHPTASIRDYYQKLKDTYPTIYRMGKDYLSETDYNRIQSKCWLY